MTAALPETDENRPVPWRALEAVPVFLLSLVVMAAGAALLSLGIKSDDTLTVAIIVLQEIALLIVVLVWVRARYDEGAERLGLRGVTPANVGIGLGVGAFGLFASYVTGGIVVSLIEAISGDPVAPPKQIEFDNPDPSSALLVLTAVSVIVLAPLAEEVFWRGFLLKGLRRSYSVWPAILVTSALFGGAHIIPLVIPSIFVLGIILAWIVERRGNLVPAIVAHMVFNTFGFVFQFVLD